MAMTETQLKDTIKSGGANLYVFYGAEGYLIEQYSRLIIRETVEEGFDAFNLQRFDGQEVTVAELEDAVEALPLMTDRKCVLVRDLDPCGSEHERLMKLLEQIPDSCVLVLWHMTVQPDSRKNGWKAYLEVAKSKGIVMKPQKKQRDSAPLLCVHRAESQDAQKAPRSAERHHNGADTLQDLR